jgi:hypothetical protein
MCELSQRHATRLIDIPRMTTRYEPHRDSPTTHCGDDCAELAAEGIHDHVIRCV